MYVIKDVLMSLSGKAVNNQICVNLLILLIYFLGKTPQLYRHDLLALQSKHLHRFSLHMNKIPEKLVPRKFALTTKVPDTKGCMKCCVARNPYNGYKYLCGAMQTGIFIMQWYDPLNKFMLLKVSSNLNTNIQGVVTMQQDLSDHSLPNKSKLLWSISFSSQDNAHFRILVFKKSRTTSSSRFRSD